MREASSEDNKNKIRLLTTEEMIDSYWNELLPTALECGMTPTQFWEDDPRLVHSYLIKHTLELDGINFQSWVIGLYVYNAVSSSLSQGFDKNSKAKYLEKPIEELNGTYIPKKQYTQQQKVNFWAKFKSNKKKGG